MGFVAVTVGFAGLGIDGHTLWEAPANMSMAVGAAALMEVLFANALWLDLR